MKLLILQFSSYNLKCYKSHIQSREES
jgi:hypothetical protein